MTGSPNTRVLPCTADIYQSDIEENSFEVNWLFNRILRHLKVHLRFMQENIPCYLLKPILMKKNAIYSNKHDQDRNNSSRIHVEFEKSHFFNCAVSCLCLQYKTANPIIPPENINATWLFVVGLFKTHDYMLGESENHHCRNFTALAWCSVSKW